MRSFDFRSRSLAVLANLTNRERFSGLLPSHDGMNDNIIYTNKKGETEVSPKKRLVDPTLFIYRLS